MYYDDFFARVLDMNNEFQSMDECGHGYPRGSCPHCVKRCLYCNEILGEETIDTYFLGECPHLICLYSPFNDAIFWRSGEYEQKFIQFCIELNIKDVGMIVGREYILPFDSEKSKFDYFVLMNDIEEIEHNVYNDPLHKGATYLYLKKV